MTDKVKYTVTIEVEADAVGPAQAVKQALDWARDTESGPAVITVQASNLSPLRAVVADGRVAQLFTGPVPPGRIVEEPTRADLAKAVESVAHRMRETASHIQEVARREAAPGRMPTSTQQATRQLYDYGSELLRLLDEDDLLFDPAPQKPAGVDPQKLSDLAFSWREVARAQSALNIAFDHIAGARVSADIKRASQCADQLSELIEGAKHDL